MLAGEHALGQILGGAGIGQGIEDDDAVLRRVLGEMGNEIGADETGATSHEDCSHG